MRTLYRSISRRLRPEDIAKHLKENFSDHFDPKELNIIRRVGSQGWNYWSMMSSDFFGEVAPSDRQQESMLRFFSCAMDANNPDSVSMTIENGWKQIGGRTRLTKTERKIRGFNRRQYMKRYRFLRKMDKRLAQFASSRALARALRVAKSGFAQDLSWEEFSADQDAAFFVAYYTARCNRRSVFTNSSQDRPFDKLAQALLDRVQTQQGLYAVAHVFPDVVSRLNDGELRLNLLGMWTKEMWRLSALLEDIAERTNVNVNTMIVRRGNDSSRWNAFAGAWNKCRQQWIALLGALDRLDVLENFCPGKVMRLMAADVVRWHEHSGGKLEPNTAVWARLPKPWEVWSSKATCTRDDVEDACAMAGLDPKKSGWVAPPSKREVVPFIPTPELVHGITVSDPLIAHVLRKAGVFSGKAAKEVPILVEVDRDPLGYALGVSSVSIKKKILR